MNFFKVLCLTFAFALSAQILGANKSALAIWKKALDLSMQNKNAQAIDQLQDLLDMDQADISEDLILMTAGRILSQDGKLDLAIKYYGQVSKSSDYWVEAKEETAWVYTRKKEYDKALAELKTATLPMFMHQVGPEPYFQKALINLRICDYKSVVNSIKEFKSRYGGRIPQLDQLAKDGRNSIMAQVLSQIDKGITDPNKMGVDLGLLPRHFQRDSEIQALFKQPKSAQRTKKLQARFQALAKEEVEEISKLLRKFQIAEVEATQRMSMKQKFTEAKEEDDSGKLVFHDDDEVWLDEVDSYKVRAKGCEPLRGKKL